MELRHFVTYLSNDPRTFSPIEQSIYLGKSSSCFGGNIFTLNIKSQDDHLRWPLDTCILKHFRYLIHLRLVSRCHQAFHQTTWLWSLPMFNVISHFLDHSISSSRLCCSSVCTDKMSLPLTWLTKSSANFRRMQRGVSWTYEINNIAPKIVPADVPLSERIQSPMSSFTLIRAYRPNKKSIS